MKSFRSPDGTQWGVDVTTPSSSNALVIFHHPDGSSSSKDRYAWFISHGSKANNVTARLDPQKDVLDLLTERDIARLFRRSFPVSTASPATSNRATGLASLSHASAGDDESNGGSARDASETREGWLPGTLRSGVLGRRS